MTKGELLQIVQELTETVSDNPEEAQEKLQRLNEAMDKYIKSELTRRKH